MTHAEMSNLELAFRLRRLGRRAPQWLAVVADRLEGMQGDPALDAAYAAGQAAASVPREQLRQQLEQAYRNGANGRKCYCGALILGKGGQTGQHCGDCNAAIGSI